MTWLNKIKLNDQINEIRQWHIVTLYYLIHRYDGAIATRYVGTWVRLYGTSVRGTWLRLQRSHAGRRCIKNEILITMLLCAGTRWHSKRSYECSCSVRQSLGYAYEHNAYMSILRCYWEWVSVSGYQAYVCMGTLLCNGKWMVKELH